MAYLIDNPDKEHIIKKRSRQPLVCTLRPNRRDPRPVSPRSVGSMAKSARYQHAEEAILFEVISNLPRVQSELCALARISLLIPPLVIALKSAVAILTLARLITGLIPAGWPSVAAISVLILSLGELILSLEQYLGSGGFIQVLADRCSERDNGD